MQPPLIGHFIVVMWTQCLYHFCSQQKFFFHVLQDICVDGEFVELLNTLQMKRILRVRYGHVVKPIQHTVKKEVIPVFTGDPRALVFRFGILRKLLITLKTLISNCYKFPSGIHVDRIPSIVYPYLLQKV